MDRQEHLRQRIAEAVTQFEREHMSVNPRSVTADFHPDSLVITLRGATCPAEQNCARDGRARELLERFYDEVFSATKLQLETALKDIVGRTVQRSRLSVDLESGDGVILFTFATESNKELGASKRSLR